MDSAELIQVLKLHLNNTPRELIQLNNYLLELLGGLRLVTLGTF